MADNTASLVVVLALAVLEEVTAEVESELWAVTVRRHEVAKRAERNRKPNSGRRGGGSLITGGGAGVDAEQLGKKSYERRSDI